jgi:hypothetical protein
MCKGRAARGFAAVRLEGIDRLGGDVRLLIEQIEDVFLAHEALAVVIQHIAERVVAIAALHPAIARVQEHDVETKYLVPRNRHVVNQPNRRVLLQMPAHLRVAELAHLVDLLGVLARHDDPRICDAQGNATHCADCTVALRNQPVFCATYHGNTARQRFVTDGWSLAAVLRL